MTHTEASLRRGIVELGLSVPEATLEKLTAYLALLVRWNRVYNLTAIHDDLKLVSHHLLDSLAVVRHLPSGPTVDVGTGAGFPGIPLALAQPQRAVTLLDSIAKKTVFLKQVIAELGLNNLQIVTDRAEHYRPALPYQVVISRAFAGIGDFIRLAGHLAAPTGFLAAMKGVYPERELAEVTQPWTVRSVIALDVPQLEAQRHLVLMQRSTAQKAD